MRGDGTPSPRVGQNLMAAYDPAGSTLPILPLGPCCPDAREGLVEATSERIRSRRDPKDDAARATISTEVAGGALVRHGSGSRRTYPPTASSFDTPTNPPSSCCRRPGRPPSASATSTWRRMQLVLSAKAAPESRDVRAARLASGVASEFPIRNCSLASFRGGEETRRRSRRRHRQRGFLTRPGARRWRTRGRFQRFSYPRTRRSRANVNGAPSVQQLNEMATDMLTWPGVVT